MIVIKHYNISENQLVFGYVYNSSGGHSEPIPMLAKDIPYFIYEYRNAPKLVVTDEEDIIIVEVLRGVVQYCADTDFLVFNILHFLLPLQLEIEKPKAFTPLVLQQSFAA